jgi:thioredoxin-like negative regulator of GroEL
MIELMVQAEQALGLGLVDQAERLYEQVASADPHNAIAVVGLARVRLERGDQAGAHELALRALIIDPENSAAIRMEARLREVLAGTGQTVAGPPAAVRPGLVARLFGRAR